VDSNLKGRKSQPSRGGRGQSGGGNSRGRRR
jgi:hypothetical protein